jgi:hypothetical protein
MATVYQCDYCKKIYEKRLRSIELPFTDQWGGYTDETDGYTRDICSICVKKVKETLTSIEELAKTELKRA